MLPQHRVQAWLRAMGSRLSAWGQASVRKMASAGADENTVLLVLGLAIGAAVGVAVILIYQLIDLIQAAALTTAGRLPGVGRFSIIVVVLAGLAAARALVLYGTHDSDGENVADVMRAVAKRGGVIHALPVGIKTASAALVIGTGGSVGAEGPVAVAGSALGSRIGRFFRSGPARLKVLVACGAASGISAAFNAPIAGVFFSLEKVMGQFGINAFPPVLVASVVAATVSRAAFGNSPVIAIPAEYGVGAASELVFYALLGVVTGVIGVLYTKGVFGAIELLNRIRRPRTQVLVAGLVVAGVAVVFRADLWGRGHETLSLELVSQRAAWFLVALSLAKLVVTAFTLAAARAGGVFTPALFIGATLGGGLGLAARDLLPGFTIVPEAFALVGMAGLVAGSAHAPLTAIMVVFEMTSDYALILPLMLCGAIAFMTARRLHPNSIYSEWLVRRGEQISAGQDAATLERLKVSVCFNRTPHVIADTATVRQMVQAIAASRQTEFPVLDGDQELVGMINFDDLRAVISQQDTLATVVVAGDLASPEFERVTPGDSLRTALQRLAVRGSHALPVVDAHRPGRLVGLITRQDIHTTYERALLQP